MQAMTFVIGPERAAADIWDVFSSVGVTMEASCTYPSTEGRNVRVVVEDHDAKLARSALLDSGFGAIDTHEVIIAPIEVKPGALGDLARRIADSGATLTTLFMALGDRVVVGADDLEKVRSII